MKHLWNIIDRMNIGAEAKYHLAFALAALFSALAGLLVWLPVSAVFPAMKGQLVCFLGLPALASLFAVYIFCGGRATGKKG